MDTNTLDVNLTVFDTPTLEIAYPPLDFALANWADATTDPTNDRCEDLLDDKKKAVRDFFEWICKPVDEITPNDVKAWHNEVKQSESIKALDADRMRALELDVNRRTNRVVVTWAVGEFERLIKTQ